MGIFKILSILRLIFSIISQIVNTPELAADAKKIKDIVEKK